MNCHVSDVPAASQISDQRKSKTYTIDYIGITLIAFLLIAIGVGLYFNNAMDEKIFFAINFAAPVSTLWLTITNVGDALFVGCLLFIIFKNNTEILGKCLLGGLAVHLSVRILKKTIQELRPCNTENVENLAHVFGEPIELTNYAMPSGHSAAIFMALGFVFLNKNFFTGTFLRCTLILSLAATAILVMLSRIALGVHWPSDVLVGAGLGLCIAAALNNVELKLTATYSLLIFVLFIPFVCLSAVSLLHVTDIESVVSNSILAIAGLISGFFLVNKLILSISVFAQSRKL